MDAFHGEVDQFARQRTTRVETILARSAAASRVRVGCTSTIQRPFTVVGEYGASFDVLDLAPKDTYMVYAHPILALSSGCLLVWICCADSSSCERRSRAWCFRVQTPQSPFSSESRHHSSMRRKPLRPRSASHARAANIGGQLRRTPSRAKRSEMYATRVREGGRAARGCGALAGAHARRGQ
jgi:hypothetical protein